jgi:hypothetical protein
MTDAFITPLFAPLRRTASDHQYISQQPQRLVRQIEIHRSKLATMIQFHAIGVKNAVG